MGILSTDINNKTIMDIIWPIIANREAIAVNQAWAGHSGSVFKNSGVNITLDTVNYAQVQQYKAVQGSKFEVPEPNPTMVPSFEYYYKPVEEGGTKTAVLLMNHGHTHTRLSHQTFMWTSRSTLRTSLASVAPDVTCVISGGSRTWATSTAATWPRRSLPTLRLSFSSRRQEERRDNIRSCHEDLCAVARLNYY